jgi:hypothetical protein
LLFELGRLALQLSQMLGADAEDVVGVGAHWFTSGGSPGPGVPGQPVAANRRTVSGGMLS